MSFPASAASTNGLTFTSPHPSPHVGYDPYPTCGLGRVPSYAALDLLTGSCELPRRLSTPNAHRARRRTPRPKTLQAMGPNGPGLAGSRGACRCFLASRRQAKDSRSPRLLWAKRPCDPRAPEAEVGGSNPFASAKHLGCNPDTWVAFHSEDIGNTLLPNGSSMGSSRQLSSSKYPRS
jgi:hypothetical protein